GGLYGLAMGQLFFGESMFSRADNASKVGFVALVEQLKGWGFVLIDCQMPSRHLHSLGARSIPRREFAAWLARHLDAPSGADWAVSASPPPSPTLRTRSIRGPTMTELARLRFCATQPLPCSYLADEQATTLFLDPSQPMDVNLYAELSELGFRRSGDHLYR